MTRTTKWPFPKHFSVYCVLGKSLKSCIFRSCSNCLIHWELFCLHSCLFCVLSFSESENIWLLWPLWKSIIIVKTTNCHSALFPSWYLTSHCIIILTLVSWEISLESLRGQVITLGRLHSLRSWEGSDFCGILSGTEPCGQLHVFISSCYLGSLALYLLLVEPFLSRWSISLILFPFLNQHQLCVPCSIQCSTCLLSDSPWSLHIQCLLSYLNFWACPCPGNVG